MTLNQFEQEAIVLEQLEWLLNYELKREVQDQDWELMSALVRVIKEFQPIEIVKDRS
jgi:hypothetical protein